MGCGGSSSTQVITAFIWGHKGSVSVKTMKLIMAYDPDTKTIVTKVPMDRVTESLLMWQNRKFYLQDLFIDDYNLGKKYKCPEIRAAFSISEYDQFNQLLETEQLTDKIGRSQNKNLDTNKKSIIVNNIRKECKEFWDMSKDFWVKNKMNAEKTDMTHFDRECFSYQVEKRSSPEKIQEFLAKKYKATSYGKLKKDVKAKIIMEKKDYRPHTVKMRKSVQCDFFVGAQRMLELQEEIRVMIFCWEDIPLLADPEFLESEMEKMRSGTKIVVSELQQAINVV
ncbi:hypothetical protein SteCoe_31217 [Stentor coeruleus]|uniref:Uncharacterized protein n=1 Tax=Stentor coeruleus TaxID=5963 RepID=A0A1R2B1W2_9CILI|nr:hypothetical protein SteCoe_31217 [Stentor coeruleus]